VLGATDVRVLPQARPGVPRVGAVPALTWAF
jgi:hypothetical protein